MPDIEYTCVGYGYYTLPQDDMQEIDLHVALAVSGSSSFPRDRRTTFYTLGSVDGQRFGHKLKNRYWFTRVQSFQDIEDEGGEFVAIVHAGYTRQSHSLLRDMLVGSCEAGPIPKLRMEDEEDGHPAVWNTNKWVGVALFHLVQRESFVPCNGIEKSVPSMYKHLQHQTEYVLENWERFMADGRISILQIGNPRDGIKDRDWEIEEMVL